MLLMHVRVVGLGQLLDVHGVVPTLPKQLSDKTLLVVDSHLLVVLLGRMMVVHRGSTGLSRCNLEGHGSILGERRATCARAMIRKFHTRVRDERLAFASVATSNGAVRVVM